MVHTFGYTSEDVAQIDDLVAWVVFGYGHRSSSPQFTQAQGTQTDALFERLYFFA